MELLQLELKTNGYFVFHKVYNNFIYKFNDGFLIIGVVTTKEILLNVPSCILIRYFCACFNLNVEHTASMTRTIPTYKLRNF
jgi:hypothetical protein